VDRIFNEIKRAIEEEMARQETGRPGAPPRASSSGGRSPRQYETWLREEQERLRGGTATEEVIEPEIQGREERRRERQRSRRSQDGRDRRSPQPPQERRESTSRHDRSEARHRRRSDDAYAGRRGRSSAMSSIARLLRTRDGVRSAIVMSEIIGRPVSLRRQDEHLIS
jgi:hypothetical protein